MITGELQKETSSGYRGEVSVGSKEPPLEHQILKY